MKTNKIEFKNVSFSYNSNKLIDKFNLSIDKNGLYLLIGENGKGKSTLIKLLSGIFNDFTGEIYINNISLRDIESSGVSDIIYIQSQKTPIFNDSFKNNVFLGRIDRGIDKKLFTKLTEDFEIKELLEAEHISDGSISGGQAQKIGIIRAFLSRKYILIFDEPTANLDNKSIEVFKHYLKDLINKCIVIIITHDRYLEDLQPYIISF